MYFDENGNLVILDYEPEDAHSYERFPFNTLVFGNRMQRITAVIEDLEQKKINLLDATKIEKKLKREVKK